MNKDFFVPDHVPVRRTPLPLRRSLEWVQDLPPSCSSLRDSLPALHEKAALFPRAVPPLSKLPLPPPSLHPDGGEKLLSALPGGNLVQTEGIACC